MGDSAPRRGAVSFDEPASDLEAKHRAVLTAIEQLEESEIYAGPFAVSSTIRGDSLALFGRVVETVLVILAVQHALNITKSTDNLYVVPVLFLFVFINSHLRYVISHWSRMVALARRRLNKTENEELAEKQRYLKSIADAKEPIATSAHDAYCLPRTSDYYYELPESIRSKFPLPGVYTLAQVRLASSEMVFAFVSNLLYLVNVYITFLLVKEIIDKINSSFSDGIWVLVKVRGGVLASGGGRLYSLGVRANTPRRQWCLCN